VGSGSTEYHEWLAGWKTDPQIEPVLGNFKNHVTAPICWLENDKLITIIGGRDRLCEWTQKELPDSNAATLASGWLNPFEQDIPL